MKINLSVRDEDLRKTLLAYGPAFLAPALWAFARFPERLRWTAPVFARIFGVAAAFYDEWTTVPGYGEALDDALSEVTTEPQRILDIATGTGFVARRMKKAFPQAAVTGVDVAHTMIAVAQHEAAAAGLELHLEAADGAALPFEDSSFDLVVTQNAFPFIDEMMRVLAPSGSAIIVWSFGGPWVEIAWPAMATRMESSGAGKTWGRRSGSGFFGMASKAEGEAEETL